MAGHEITIDVDDLEARKLLDGAASDETRKAVLEAAGASMRADLTRHFRDREKEPVDNSVWPKLGQKFPKRYFWSGTRGNSVAEAIREPRIDGDTVTVNIDSPALEHKIAENPPPIRPGAGRKFLAVPANARAAGWDGRPTDFRGAGEMAFAFARASDDPHRWVPALVAHTHYQRQITKGKKKGQLAIARAGQTATHGAGEVQYWLIREARTKHDPKALPPEDALAESARTVALGVFARIAGGRP